MALLAFNKWRQHENYGIGVGWHNTENTAEAPIAIRKSFLLQMVFIDALAIQTLNRHLEGQLFP